MCAEMVCMYVGVCSSSVTHPPAYGCPPGYIHRRWALKTHTHTIFLHAHILFWEGLHGEPGRRLHSVVHLLLPTESSSAAREPCPLPRVPPALLSVPCREPMLCTVLCGSNAASVSTLLLLLLFARCPVWTVPGVSRVPL